jgi:predicted SnoaL-like aldol condensation-catalyzing enzyme
MKANAAKGIKMRYEEIGLVVAEGNFVLTGASGQLGGAPTAFYDLFRLEDGLIVEHWDVIAPSKLTICPKATLVRSNSQSSATYAKGAG